MTMVEGGMFPICYEKGAMLTAIEYNEDPLSSLTFVFGNGLRSPHP